MSNRHAREGRTLSRQDLDFFPTPPRATAALLEREAFPGLIWECACGDGAMARVIEAAGHQVVATDLVDRGYGKAGVDFLMEYRLPDRCESIVTNPPFRLATQFVEHALDLGARKVAMLCRVAFLEGQERGGGIHRRLSRVWVFSSRITMMHGSLGAPTDDARGAMAFAWFVWERHHSGPHLGFIA
ncbi:MAG: hypothetical protein K2X46_11105 [Roseomonas sp.]|nr:hypothetical protein [Roseomonas sp.]